jgi:hypothetical protein
MDVGVDDIENVPGDSLDEDVADMAYNGVGGGKSIVESDG